MKTNPQRYKLLVASARSRAILQSRDFARMRIHPQAISRLVGKGQLIRVGRGRYMLPEAEHSENLGLALVAAAVPRSVICLLSALRFHGIGTQAPHDVWIAVKQAAARPRLDYPPIRVTLVSGSAFTFGIERHRIDGVPVRIYSPAKTVADCFKFRNKIGLEVAIEALREALRAKRCTREELWIAGKACRVATVMRPYLESI
jgi:predicted transcriptional regulator of viral defense system